MTTTLNKTWIKTSISHPDIQRMVLVWDARINGCRIARLILRNGGLHWETDNRLQYPKNDEVFSYWQLLPEGPCS